MLLAATRWRGPVCVPLVDGAFDDRDFCITYPSLLELYIYQERRGEERE
jgi:hypothetical protein